MLNSLIKLALKQRVLVIALSFLLLVVGTWQALNLPIDVFPDLNRPVVTIMTEASGLAPEETEVQVSMPIENVLNGLPGLIRLRSSSTSGISIVYAEFDWGTDIFKNRQIVAERLELVKTKLPPNMSPVMTPSSSIMGEIMFIGLTSPNEEMNPMELRTLAEWTLRPRLMAIPGVSEIITIGGDLKQYQILISAEKLQMKGLTIEDLKHSLEEIGLNLFRGGTDLAKIKKTFAEEKKLEIEKNILKNKFTVAKFLLLGERFILEKEADLINTSLQEFEGLKGIAAKRTNSGLSSAADSLELEIKTKQLKQKLSHLELELKKNILALFEALGATPNLKEFIEDYNKIKTKLSELTLKNDETVSLESNKYLLHLQAQLEVFELELKTARQKFMPQVDLEAKYGQITPMKKLLDRSDEYMVALNIKIPLFDRGVSNLEQQKIKGDYERQRKIFQLANLTMPMQNEILRQEIIDTKIKLENDKKILEKRIKLKKLISADFRRGVKEIGDLVDSWTESIDAEVEFMKSELQSNTKLLSFSLLNSIDSHANHQ